MMSGMAAEAAGAAATSKLGYRPALDGLRALLIVGVIAAHLHLPGTGGGAIGVHVFFTLSGFLITRLLLEEHDRGRIDLPGFWRRRVARLVPGALALLAGSVVFAVLVADRVTAAGTLRAVPAVALYVANWQQQYTSDVGALGHMWSLSVEEQFYVAWPLLLIGLLATGAPPRRIGWAVGIGAVAVCTLIRWRLPVEAQHRTDYVADVLLIGCAAALITYRRTFTIPRWVTACAAGWLAFCVAVFPSTTGRWFGDWQTRWGLSLLAVAAAVVVVAVAGGCRPLEHPVLVTIGRLSYSLYLWHVLAIYLAGVYGWGLPVTVAAIVGLSCASYWCVEQPMRRRLSRAEVDHLERRDRRIERPVGAVQVEVDDLQVVG